MGNISIGYDVIAIKDAIKQIQRNIKQLKEKKAQAIATTDSAGKIQQFYEDKIAAQKITLIWLRKFR